MFQKILFNISLLILLLISPNLLFSQEDNSEEYKKIKTDSTLRIFNDTLHLVRRNDEYGLINPKSSNIICKWSNISENTAMYPNMYLIDSARYHGLIHKKSGRIILNPIWNYIDTFKNDIAILHNIFYIKYADKYNLKGLVDVNGTTILPPLYHIKRGLDGSFLIKHIETQKIERLDKKGKFIENVKHNILMLPVAAYDEMTDSFIIDSVFANFNKTILTPLGNDGIGLIDSSGKLSSNRYVLESCIIKDPVSYLTLENKKYLQNGANESHQDWFNYAYINSGDIYTSDTRKVNLNQDTFIFERNKLKGLLNKNGIVWGNLYLHIGKLNDNKYYSISKDSILTFWDSNLKKYWESTFKVSYFIKIFGTVNKIYLPNENEIIIDDDGIIKMSYKYKNIIYLCDSLFIAKDTNGYNVLTHDEKYIIKSRNFLKIFPLVNRPKKNTNPVNRLEIFYLVMNQNEKLAIYDFNGKQMTDFLYERVEIEMFSSFFIKREGKWGLMNIDGKTIVEPKWTNLEFNFCEGYYIPTYKQNGKNYTIDITGKDIEINEIPCSGFIKEQIIKK